MSGELTAIAKMPLRPLAIAEALLTTAIWGSSFVFVKIALPYMGPLTIAALRYFLAFLLLLPFLGQRKGALCAIPSNLWLRLFFIGLSVYAIGNGALFWGLKYLPATTASLFLSILPVIILFTGAIWLKELPTFGQTVGVFIAITGSILFFWPGLKPGEPFGMVIVAVGLVGFTAFVILGREIARDKLVDTLALTAVPLGFGGTVLLVAALLLEGLPASDPIAWGVVLWLAIINTAVGYMLYNHSLQTLTALEMNMFLNLAPLVTALLAWLLLGEALAAIQITGIVTVISGVILVQVAGERQGKKTD